MKCITLEKQTIVKRVILPSDGGKPVHGDVGPWSVRYGKGAKETIWGKVRRLATGTDGAGRGKLLSDGGHGGPSEMLLRDGQGPTKPLNGKQLWKRIPTEAPETLLARGTDAQSVGHLSEIGESPWASWTNPLNLSPGCTHHTGIW